MLHLIETKTTEKHPKDTHAHAHTHRLFLLTKNKKSLHIF